MAAAADDPNDVWGNAAFKPDVSDKALPTVQIRTNRIVGTDPAEKVPLSSVDTFVRNLKIKAERGNKGLVFVGSDASVDLRVNGYPLDTGEELPMDVNNLKLVYIQVAEAGDAVRIIYGK